MLQGSGAIRFSDIIREFGRANGSGGVSLGRYRVSETYGAMSNLPIDTGVPQSGQIAFSNFYNKQLNVVVNYYHGSDERRVLARNRYNNGPGNGRTNVIGGFRQKPGNSSGTRVILHVNHRIGSNRTTDSGGLTCAMRTGNWESGTNLDLYVGGNGQIMGAGADGGKGGNRGRGCTNGKRANTGLGISYPLDIWNYGLIAGGGGGGGGGKGGKNDSRRRRRWRRRKKIKRRRRRWRRWRSSFLVVGVAVAVAMAAEAVIVVVRVDLVVAAVLSRYQWCSQWGLVRWFKFILWRF